MATTFLDLPTELVESIACLSRPQDIANLRLTCRDLNAKAVQGCFREYFRRWTTTMTNKDMRRFERVTRHCGLPCTLETLQIDSDADFVAEIPVFTRDRIPQLLAKAFSNRAACAQQQTGLTLCLAADTWSDTALADTCTAVARSVFATVFRALGQSGLRVRMLDIWSSGGFCGIAIDQFDPIIRLPYISGSLKNVRYLGLTLSHHDEVFAQRRGRPSRPTRPLKERDDSALAVRCVNDIARFLGLMPALEEFELRWYNLRVATATRADTLEQRFFDTAWQALGQNSLADIRLRGIHASEATLLDFLKQHQPRVVFLEEIHLHTGSFRAIFAHLTTGMPQLEDYSLSDLFEMHDGAVIFEGGGRCIQRSRYTSGGERKDIKHPIEYFVRTTGDNHWDLKGPSFDDEWSDEDDSEERPEAEQRRFQYGPPHRNM